ncbi:MAG: hypothetical protein H7145_22550 [Akkermansiaceae bacterium]|nr:hypothetical protein [Armatimonadota bacterium]
MYNDSTPPLISHAKETASPVQIGRGVAHANGARPRHKYIILGAGCAGLSLCWYLLEAGVRDPILILDRKTEFRNDRTWCFWDTEPTPFTHLATHRWPAWTVRGGNDEAGVRAASPATPYVRLRGGDFYRMVLDRIKAHPNVTVRLGVPITGGYRDEPDGVCVPTGAGDCHGEFLFDALALGSPRFPVARPGDLTFLQQFFGQVVRTERDVFDPQTVTLMDFSVTSPVTEPDPAIRFMYLLPISPREALVENTLLLPTVGGAKDALAPPENAATGRRAIAAYLSARYDSPAFTVTSEEQGLIPMTTRDFPLRTGQRTFAIGLAGGAARPSSGYAFLRIQKRCQALALAVTTGDWKPVDQTFSPPRTAMLDRIFLQAMRQNPGAVPDYFKRMFAHVPPDMLVRLLSDSASFRDCLGVVRVLPLGDFVRAAAFCVPHLWADKRGGPH